MGIVLVEQYFDFAYELADSVVVLERGRVTLSGHKSDFAKDAILAKVSV